MCQQLRIRVPPTSLTQGETLIKWPLSPGAHPPPVSPSGSSACLPLRQEEATGRKGYIAQDHKLSAEGQRTPVQAERTVGSGAYRTLVQGFPKKQRKFKTSFPPQFLENIFLY